MLPPKQGCEHRGHTIIVEDAVPGRFGGRGVNRAQYGGRGKGDLGGGESDERSVPEVCSVDRSVPATQDGGDQDWDRRERGKRMQQWDSGGLCAMPIEQKGNCR